jgi:hypothetical protein
MKNNIDNCKFILLAKSRSKVRPIPAWGIHDLSKHINLFSQIFLGQSVAPN